MTWRVLSWVLCVSVASVVGWLLAPDTTLRWPLAVACAALGALAWLAMDAWRGVRLLNWLRVGDTSTTPVSGGLWGEVFERARKLVRQRDRALQASEARLQEFLSALQASPNGVVLLDADNRIEWFNQTAAEHFGLDPQRDMQQHFGNLVRDPGFAAYFSARNFSGGVVLPGRDNTPTKPVQLSVHVHPYGEGRCLVLSRDITAVEQAETMRRDFVANVSHEIRTPLTVLSGFVETLQTLHLDAQERDKYLVLMAQQSQRMQSLVNDLLMLSRLEGSPLPSITEWVPVGPLMAQCAQDAIELSTLLWHQPQSIQLSGGEDLEIAGAAGELLSALSNLVGNAVRYTPPDKGIEVCCEVPGHGGCVLAVTDHGSGIAPEHLPRLTERFYRVDRSRSRETGGTGLGLAIVKHVAHRHAAELHITSTPGVGSRFAIEFPASRVRRQQTH